MAAAGTVSSSLAGKKTKPWCCGAQALKLSWPCSFSLGFKDRITLAFSDQEKRLPHQLCIDFLMSPVLSLSEGARFVPQVTSRLLPGLARRLNRPPFKNPFVVFAPFCDSFFVSSLPRPLLPGVKDGCPARAQSRFGGSQRDTSCRGLSCAGSPGSP